MRKHYYIGKLINMTGVTYIAPCGFASDDPTRLSLNENFVTCQHCQRYANQVPADPLGPVAVLAREKP